jgi:DNA-binding IclR family transcriptional regulator
LNINDTIEKGLGGLGKIKLIKALAEEDRMMTIYSLHKKTHLKREDIKRNLNDLIEIEWVKEEKLANVLYRLNRQNENVQHLLTFFKNVEYIYYP